MQSWVCKKKAKKVKAIEEEEQSYLSWSCT